jgi:signal transduction histidine kinase
MKLQTQTNLYNILYSGIILLLTGIFLQFTIFRIYYKQIDDGIKTEREIIEEEVEHLDTVPDYTSIFGHQIEVSLLREPVKKQEFYRDLKLYNQTTHSIDLFRHHYFAKNRLNGMGYTISILKPMTEIHKFKGVVMLSILLTFIFLLITTFATAYFINRRLWKPFYHTLSELKQFNIDAPAVLSMKETDIKEFRQLNQIIGSLTHKLRRDFIRMKEFTENLSHEINTMLAVILTKVELILQKEDLSLEQVEHFKTIYHVTSKLTHLNNGLILLAKIDNKYYSEVEEIKVSPIIEDQIYALDDFIRQKQIRIETNLEPAILILNKTLAEILFSNIIVNAVKHNIYNGFIKIKLDYDSIIVENSSDTKHIGGGNEYLANDDSNSPLKSLGLGLEIVKRICRIYNFVLTISDIQGIHRIEIGFSH